MKDEMTAEQRVKAVHQLAYCFPDPEIAAIAHLSFDERFEALFEREKLHVLPNGHKAYEYREAISGGGDESASSLYSDWRDKPHRLVYDLLRCLDIYAKTIATERAAREAAEAKLAIAITPEQCARVANDCADKLASLQAQVDAMTAAREELMQMVQEMERLAGEATPGQWKTVVHAMDDRWGVTESESPVSSKSIAQMVWSWDAAFIAHHNPATITKLCTLIRQSLTAANGGDEWQVR